MQTMQKMFTTWTCSEWRSKKSRTLWGKLQYRISKIKQCKKWCHGQSSQPCKSSLSNCCLFAFSDCRLSFSQTVACPVSQTVARQLSQNVARRSSQTVACPALSKLFHNMIACVLNNLLYHLYKQIVFLAISIIRLQICSVCAKIVICNLAFISQ